MKIPPKFLSFFDDLIVSKFTFKFLTLCIFKSEYQGNVVGNSTVEYFVNLL